MLVVDYTKTFSQMIDNCGGKISQYFPRRLQVHGNGCVMVEAAIFDFGIEYNLSIEHGLEYNINNEWRLDEYKLEADVCTAMESEGFRPARVEELLAFGAQNPEEQRKKAIAALGTKLHDGQSRHLSTSYLYVSFKERYLGTYAQPIQQAWNPGFRFLGVRIS